MRQRSGRNTFTIALILLVCLYSAPVFGQDNPQTDQETGQEIPLPTVEEDPEYQPDSLNIIQDEPLMAPEDNLEDSLEILEAKGSDSSAIVETIRIEPSTENVPVHEYHPVSVACGQCGTVNDWNNQHCINCGGSLSNVKKQWSRLNSALKLSTVEPGISRKFHLRNGEVVSGLVSDIEDDSIAVIETEDGILKVLTGDILADISDLIKIDGTRLSGSVFSEDYHTISLNTPYGITHLPKRDIRTINHYYWDRKIERDVVEIRQEEMIDIFGDPTAFPLQPEIIYLKGLSLSYGFSRSFMIKTHLGHDFTGDLNLHPLYRFIHRELKGSEISVAVGAMLYNYHSSKQEAERYSHWIIDTTYDTRLDESGAPAVDRTLKERDKKDFFWSAYLVVSSRRGLVDRRGNWGWHLGMGTNALALDKPVLNNGYKWDDAFSFPYRAWAAVDYDLTEQLKLIVKAFADNGHKMIDLTESIQTYYDFTGTPFRMESQNGDYKLVDLDLGLFWTISDALRIELHTRFPFVTMSWKF